MRRLAAMARSLCRSSPELAGKPSPTTPRVRPGPSVSAPPHRQGGPPQSWPALTSLDNGTARPYWNIEDCVLHPGRTSPPNDCARAVTFCKRTQSSIEKYVHDFGRPTPQGRSAPSGTVPYSRWRPAPSGTSCAAGCVSPQAGAFDAVGDRIPVPARAECPRRKGKVPGRVKRPHRRTRTLSPTPPCPSRPHRHRAGPHTCWDPARRHGD